MKNQKFPRVLILFLVAAVFLGTILPGTASADFRFVFLADSRGSSYGHPVNTTELNGLVADIQLLDTPPNFVVFGGDLSYRAHPAWWSDWDNILSQLSIPLYVIKGNHELYEDKNGKVVTRLANQVAFQTHCQNNYQNPRDTYPPGHPNYRYLAYSFPFGKGADKSLFIVLDSFYMWKGKSHEDKILYGGITDTQLAWVENLLSTAKGQGFKHKFIMTHAPIYPVSSGGARDRDSLFALAKLMDKYNVDIFFAGHEHLYDRLFIDKKVDTVFKNTVLQLISGVAGAPFSKKSTSFGKRKTIYGKDEYVVVDVKGSNLEFFTVGGTKSSGYSVIDSCRRSGTVWTCH